MDEILGRQFRVDEICYTVVDVRNFTGDTLVYAESDAEEKGHSARTAFHYTDIETILFDARVPAG